jgi:hypothetical protein
VRPYWLLLHGGIVKSVLCNCDCFLIYCEPHMSSNNSLFIHQSSLLRLQQTHMKAKRGKSRREIAAEFCLSVSLSYRKGSLTCCEILRHGIEGFTSAPKEVVLRIIIALKIPSLSAGFEYANIWSNGKHDNHYTTESDVYVLSGSCK